MGWRWCGGEGVGVDHYIATVSVKECGSTFSSRAFFPLSVHSTWNDLPLPLRQKPSLDTFESDLKTLLLPKL